MKVGPDGDIPIGTFEPCKTRNVVDIATEPFEKVNIECTESECRVSNNTAQVAAALREAASSGNDNEVARLVLVDGVDVNSPGEGGVTPLMLASTKGHIATVRRLLNAGAMVNAQQRSGLPCWSIDSISRSLNLPPVPVMAGLL